MKYTNILFHQHIGWLFKKYWNVQGKRKLLDTGVFKTLQQKNIPIYNPKNILNDQQPQRVKEIPDYVVPSPTFDENHSEWQTRICFMYRDENVLLEGLDQAKVLTQTIELQEGLPKQITLNSVASNIHKQVQQIIMNSFVFDAEQQKLPKQKDLERPAWNFPRNYGIIDKRRNTLIITKLLQLIESVSPMHIVRERNVLHNLHFWYPFEKSGELIQFQLKGDTLITTSKRLPPITNKSTESFNLPNIFPIKYTVTLTPENIYKGCNVYPIQQHLPRSHPHTIFAHYNETEIKNIFEEPVTETQILGRTLMKAFTVAATYAREIYKENVTKIPQPITVQCVQTDGCFYHFGIFQLNTLSSEENGIKNVWFQTPLLKLFTSCSYQQGKPTLIGYNENVVKYLFAFYNNV